MYVQPHNSKKSMCYTVKMLHQSTCLQAIDIELTIIVMDKRYKNIPTFGKYPPSQIEVGIIKVDRCFRELYWIVYFVISD